MTTETVSDPLPTAGFWKRVLDRNPFYPLSAVLLLFGIHRLSTDPLFLPDEAAKLLFNFGALEFYELLTVVTAVLLVRKLIRYDASLLVTLDFMLAMTPFILITQAVLIGKPLAARLSTAAALLVLLRVRVLTQFFGQLPKTLFGAGAILLLANSALPFLYRSIMEEDVANWAQPSRWGWCIFLPVFQVACLWIKPKPNQPQPWWPALLFHLWIAATAVHLRCIDYISNFPFQPAVFAPLLWTAAWTFIFRAPRWLTSDLARLVDKAWPVLPTLALLPALARPDSFTLTCLAAPNAFLLIARDIRQRHPWALHLAWISILLAVFGLPQQSSWWPQAAIFPSQLHPWVVALTLAVAGCGLLTKRHYFAIIGMVALVEITISLPQTIHFAIQFGLTYLLLHSLLWSHHPKRIEQMLQLAISVVLVIHAYFWANYAPAKAATVLRCEGLLLCGVCAALFWSTGRAVPWRLALPGPLLLLAPLTPALRQVLRAAPQGILLLLSSFLIFAMGTLLALGKHYLQTAKTPPGETEDTS
jgi:hypothetical protein